MKPLVALFRGINVGGKNILPMDLLVNLFTEMKFKYVKTYIQSGNVIFSCEEENIQQISNQISSSIKTKFNFEPKIHILEIEELENAIKRNPFPECESEPKTLHLGFLSEKPVTPDIEGLEATKKESERFRLIEKVFYLSAPEGIGRSKLVSERERLLGVSVTDRNWRTVTKIWEMLNK